MRSPSFRDAWVTGLAPGGERTVNVSGGLVAVISATDAFELSLGDDSFFFAASGLGYRPMGERGETLTFPNIRIRNTSANPLDVHLQVGTGEIVDNRAIFGGVAVPVQPITFAAPQPVTQSGNWSIQPITFAAPQPIQPITFAAPQDVTQGGPWNVGQAGVWSVGLTDINLPRAAVPTSIPHQNHVACPAGVSTIVTASAARRGIVLRHLGTETMWIKSVSSAADTGIPIAPGERLEVRTDGNLYIRNPATFSQSVSRGEMVW